MVIKILYLLSGRLAPPKLPLTQQLKGHIQTAWQYGVMCWRDVKDMGFLWGHVRHNRHWPRDLVCLPFNKCDQTSCMSMQPEDALTTTHRRWGNRQKTQIQMCVVTWKAGNTSITVKTQTQVLLKGPLYAFWGFPFPVVCYIGFW